MNRSLLITVIILLVAASVKCSFGRSGKINETSIPCLDNYGITLEQYERLPERVRKKMPVTLSESDSLLVKIAVLGDDGESVYPKDFEVEGVSGTIVHTKGKVYEVRDRNNKVLGFIHKSNDNKRKAVVSPTGDMLFGDLGLYFGLGVLVITVIYVVYLLIILSMFTEE